MIADFGFRIADLGQVLAQISPEDGVKLVNELSSKNDRWLFIALLVIFLLAMAWVVRWGSAQMRELQSEIKQVRDAHAKEMGEIRDKHEAQLLQFAERFASIVQDNSKAFLMFAQSMSTKPAPQVVPMDLRP